MITMTSNWHTSLSQTLPYRNINNKLRDASFCSYMNNNEESFVPQLAASSPIMSGQDKNLCSERKGQEDGEIGVFSAEKYFNGAMDDSPRIVKIGARNNQLCVKDQERTDQTLVKPRVQAAGTPSIRSESSWNSQNALLQSVLKHNIPNPNPNPCSKKTNKLQGKSFFAGLRCKCSCSDKDSVDITEHGGQTIFERSADNVTVQAKTINTTEPMRKTAVKENSFCLPSMSSETIKINEEVEEEEPRKSIEVFSCPVTEKKNKSLTVERKVRMLSRKDSSPRGEEIEFAATSPGDKCFETESDASSDLFEIESLTGKGKANPFLATQLSDATSECVTPTAYAPSEASIEWSVVTASAADFSVMSDCEEVRASPVKTLSSVAKNRSILAELPKGRRPSSILLGCKNEKAIRVAEDAHMTTLNQKANNNYDPRIRRMSDSFALVPAAVTRFQAETKLKGFDSRQRQHVLAAAATRIHLPPRSISPRSSHPLYIQ